MFGSVGLTRKVMSLLSWQRRAKSLRVRVRSTNQPAPSALSAAINELSGAAATVGAGGWVGAASAARVGGTSVGCGSGVDEGTSVGGWVGTTVTTTVSTTFSTTVSTMTTAVWVGSGGDWVAVGCSTGGGAAQA